MQDLGLCLMRHKSGNLHLVEYLVDRGANVNDRLSLRNARKGTFNRIVKYLISKGANVKP